MMETKMFTRKELIGETKVNVTEQPIDVLTIARAVARARTLEGDDAAFMIVNLDALRERVQLWQRELPQIEPFYAVKCNSDETLLQSLAALDVGFDCASREEIVTIRRMGVSPDRIIYAHPCKAPGQIEHADVAGVRMMTFDSVEELQKIAAHHERPQLILRIAVSDPTATHPLAFKFGADPIKLAPKLLEIAANIGVNVVGISFHVGCGCNDPSTYRTALQLTRNLFDIGIALGHKMEIVDIGGGFPGGERHKPFEKFSAIIRTAVADFFPEPSVRVIAEPGRFFAARSCTIVLSVMARRAVPADKITMNPSDAASTGYMYYVNDGAYGSFNCIKYDHVRTIGRPLFDKEGKQYPSTIWGPTCDSGDKIEENKMMRAVEVGDWLIYEDMGAYTCAASSTFNGFPRPTPIHVISERTWQSLDV